MLTFKILSGKQAGCLWAARRFPVRIGRATNADLRLDEAGVWEEHASVRLAPREGFVVKPGPDAIVLVNTEPVQEMSLKNGDIVELGAAKLQFWLGPPKQRGLGFRESLTWIGIALVSIGQVALIYLLLR